MTELLSYNTIISYVMTGSMILSIILFIYGCYDSDKHMSREITFSRIIGIWALIIASMNIIVFLLTLLIVHYLTNT